MPDAVEAGESYSKLEISDPNTLYQYLGGEDGSGYPLEVLNGGQTNDSIYNSNFFGSPNCEAFGVLFVDLFNFSVNNEDGISKLLWETLSEKENDFFEIQWRTGTQEWVKIGKVDGAGTSENRLYYSFVHESQIMVKIITEL